MCVIETIVQYHHRLLIRTFIPQTLNPDSFAQSLADTTRGHVEPRALTHTQSHPHTHRLPIPTVLSLTW